MADIDQQKLADLTDINLNDMYVSAGLKHSRLGQSLARILLKPAARKFAMQVLDYDAAVAADGLAQGSRGFVAQFAERVRAEGVEHVPTDGPLLILSNHPGMADTLALFSCIPRQDLRILASSRPFLKTMQATSRHLISIDEASDQRFDVLRSAAGHLRKGGAILTFPAGKIEPDPSVLPGAVASLDSWHPSTGLFARMVPRLKIVPVIVSGVIARQAVFHLLTHIRRKRADRESFGASLQLIMKELRPEAWPITIFVRFAPAICAAELAHLREPAEITQAITRRIKPFLNEIVQAGGETG